MRKRIKMLTPAVGPDYSASPGDVIELPAEEADRFVNAGYAEYEEEVIEATDPMIGVRKAKKR